MARGQILILINLMFIAVYANNLDADFHYAERALETGKLSIAESYFKMFLKEQPYHPYAKDALYFLTRIYDQQNDFVNYLTITNNFLENYGYDERSAGLFNQLLHRLYDRDAYVVALEYIKHYEFLLTDYDILEMIGHGLYKQEDYLFAEYIYGLCPEKDTINILMARISSDPLRKKGLYERIAGIKGDVYRTIFLLEKGDTIDAFELYKSIKTADMDDGLLYRYTKISRLFDETNFLKGITRLKQVARFRNKALLLEGLDCGSLAVRVEAQDQEELLLLNRFFDINLFSKKKPDSNFLQGLIGDTLTEEKIMSAKMEYDANFYLDSLHATMLLRNNDLVEAYNMIKPYLAFCNTQKYARKIQGLYYFMGGNYYKSAQNFILSQTKAPNLIFLLATSLSKMNKGAFSYYEYVIFNAQDSALIQQAKRSLIEISFNAGRYDIVIDMDVPLTTKDTSLIKMKAYSYAHTGKLKKADSLWHEYFEISDHTLLSHYGQYLIDSKSFKRAYDLYDSLFEYTDNFLDEELHYNYARSAMLKGEPDTALRIFHQHIEMFGKAEYENYVYFKIASIYYLHQRFDSAAYYYGLASAEDSLRYDAWQNQMICYKKAGLWQGVIKTVNKLMPLAEAKNMANLYFEIGYAYFRSGQVGHAISNLHKAVTIEPSMEHFYWLAEAYLARASFVPALYYYRKIVNFSPTDEMWAPTAQYKIGVTLEFMGHDNEAKEVYKDIIRKRGIGDTWGIEAQKRLDVIE